MDTAETKIKKEISEYLDSLGPRCWHVPFHNVGYTRNGIPDRIVCYRGRFLALEVKSGPEKEPTAWQVREITAISKADGRAAVVWSVEQVRQIIEQIDLDLMLSSCFA